MDESTPKPQTSSSFDPKSLIKKLLTATEARLAFKMGLAASISLVLGLSFGKVLDRPDTLVSGLWCVMSSIVVVQAFLGATYKAAWTRFLGVLIGSTAGAILINVIGADAFSLGVSVFITIILCSLLGIKDSFRIAGLSTAVIIVMGGLHPLINPWLFSFYRFIDSCIGIFVGVIVARFVWPQRALENIRLNIGKTINLLNKLYDFASDVEGHTQTNQSAIEGIPAQIEALLLENRNNQKEADIELHDDASARGNWALAIDQVETIFEAVSSLNAVQKETLSKIFDDSLASAVTDVIGKTDRSFQEIEKHMKYEAVSLAPEELQLSLKRLGEELGRFRGTRTTRKFNLEDVESYFVYFYSLRTIGEALIKMEAVVTTLNEAS